MTRMLTRIRTRCYPHGSPLHRFRRYTDLINSSHLQTRHLMTQQSHPPSWILAEPDEIMSWPQVRGDGIPACLSINTKTWSYHSIPWEGRGSKTITIQRRKRNHLSNHLPSQSILRFNQWDQQLAILKQGQNKQETSIKGLRIRKDCFLQEVHAWNFISHDNWQTAVRVELQWKLDLWSDDWLMQKMEQSNPFFASPVTN